MQHLITAERLLTGRAGQRIDKGSVLVEDDTIVAVGPKHDVEQQIRGDVRRSEYPGHTVMPGLINCHVHLAFDTSLDPVGTLQATDDQDLLRGMAERAQQLLGAGVTTCRDLGDRNGIALRLRDAIRVGEFTGPSILAAGAPLTVPEGHCWFLGGAVSGETAIREQVQRNAAAGADVIKVMASGGQLTPNSPAMWESQFTTDELRVIVDEASRAGLPVAAHAHGTEAIVSAVDAGVSTIEHCTWMGPNGPDRRDDVAKRMAELGISACAASSRNWRTIIEKVGPEKAEQIYGRLTWLDELGVPLITGTDAGLPRSVFDDFAGALELYAHLGFSHARIIEMATASSASALGLSATTGQLAPGMRADLLVVEGDPIADLDALRHLELVVTGGKPHQPSPARSGN